eukprot:gnl/MRDRNA2_/MRDRNA2_80742_c0_seq1.p1 gnl/MRDRNA2_/MRDRNA2_80742_c0~~gnl/MRDRNA2_/MRDRNA2_80742_c0_seq1.p1  ORF type:complete len:480 (+),score=56.12 gnl/MRDRNA2_/MRDRNA2_80742_c0_seq1:81-1520(+)
MPVGLNDIHEAGLRLGEVAGEGRCLVACRPFPAGTILLAETPIARDSKALCAKHMSKNPSSFDLLRGHENLAAADMKGETRPFLVEVETNSFAFGGKCVVFNAFSMLNHACATSTEEKACFSILSTGEEPVTDSLQVKLVATRDIEVDEPIRISYHELLADPQSKLERIQAHCGGNCKCSVCRAQGSQKDVCQLGRVISIGTCCQHCSGGGPDPGVGDLVELQGLTSSSEYNALHGRVLQTRADGRFLVFVLYQGTEKQLWLKSENLWPLNKGTGQNLMKCSRCKAVWFCSRECQRAAWKEHQRFCEPESKGFEQEYQELILHKQRFDSRAERQDAPLQDVLKLFNMGEMFIRKWIQPGRAHRPALGHRMVQSAAECAITAGTLALWRQLTDGTLDGNVWARVAAVAQQHASYVRSVVPRFHIAHWTALYHFRGLLSLRSLGTGGDPAMERAAKELESDFGRQLDVLSVRSRSRCYVIS